MGRLTRIETCLLFELGMVLSFFIIFHEALSEAGKTPEIQRMALIILLGCVLLANYNDCLIVRLFHSSVVDCDRNRILKLTRIAFISNTPIFFCVLEGFSHVRNVPGSVRVLSLCAFMGALCHYIVSLLVATFGEQTE